MDALQRLINRSAMSLGARSLAAAASFRVSTTLAERFTQWPSDPSPLKLETSPNRLSFFDGRSIRAFKKMFLLTTAIIGILMFCEGILLSSWYRDGLHPGFAFLGIQAVAGIIALLVCCYQGKRMGEYERERMGKRKGSLGESAVAVELAALPSSFFVLNDIRTPFGNIDHLVVRPTGLFAIETKSWRGVITADGQGELLANARPTSQPAVQRFFRRIITVRDQLMALAGRNLFIQGIMVFPKARVDAPFGLTQNVHCITDDWLCKEIENPTFPKKLSSDDVEQIVQAFKEIAGMRCDSSTTDRTHAASVEAAS